MRNITPKIKNKSPGTSNRSSSTNVLRQLHLELISLEEENRTLRQILASSSDPIIITTNEPKIIYVNLAWEKLTGYSFEEVIGKNPRFLQSGKTPRYVYKKMWKTLLLGQTFTSEKVINKKKNGNEYQIRSNIYPVLQNGKAIYYVQLQHNITSIKRLEELQKELLSAAAHELKTPITVLKLLTQSHIYKAQKQGNDSISINELKMIDKEIDRFIRIINDMLDSSRFETGKLLMNYEQVNVGQLIISIVEKIQIYTKTHNIVYAHKIKDIFVVADPQRLEQVLLNLLSNAIKYSPEDSQITVSLINDDKKITVSVQDEGIGIPKSKQKLIFDRYYQVKTKKRQGFGLGLYISKEIIKQHHGKLWVESNGKKGSLFLFSLPLKTD